MIYNHDAQMLHSVALLTFVFIEDTNAGPLGESPVCLTQPSPQMDFFVLYTLFLHFDFTRSKASQKLPENKRLLRPSDVLFK